MMRAQVKKLLLQVREVWLILSITLLFLLLFEVGLSLGYAMLDRARADSGAADWRARADVYAGVAWARDYYREFEESSATRWASYVYWRRQPYQGRYINVDADGLRRTWTCAEGRAPAGGGRRIFVFGGSTLWGVGARDDFTIPSLLAAELAEAGTACEVTNYGESGYVSSQEVIALIQELRAGNIPDLVIFYDGVNDTYSAYQQQVAGLPQNETNRIREFNLSHARGSPALRTLCLHRMVDSLSLTRLARGVLRRVGIMPPAGDAATYWGDTNNDVAGKEALFRNVLAVYRANVRLVEALGKQYGFQSLFYWQPTVFDKSHRTAYEEVQRKSVEGLEPFYGEVNARLREGKFEAEHDGAFHDLTGIFSDASRPVYIDWCHVSEWGNGLVAERMAADVAGLLAAGKTLANPVLAPP